MDMFKRKPGRPKKDEETTKVSNPDILEVLEQDENTTIPPLPPPKVERELSAEEKEYMLKLQEFANTIPNIPYPMPSALIWMELKEIKQALYDLTDLMDKAIQQNE